MYIQYCIVKLSHVQNIKTNELTNNEMHRLHKTPTHADKSKTLKNLFFTKDS